MARPIESMSRPVHYYDPRSDAGPPFRRGEAGVVWLSDDGFFETDTRVELAPNSYHSLFAHGVVESLAALPLDVGPLREGGEAVLSPTAMTDVLRVFYEADRQTYGAEHDLLIAAEFGSPPIDYRLAVDNREYQRTLSKLQFLASQAAHMGHGLRLKL